MPKPKNIGDMFIKTLNEAISREEVVALFEQLTSALKKYKDELGQTAAKDKDDLTTQTAKLQDFVANATQQLRAAVDDNKEITRSEARTLKRYIDEEVNKAIEMIPDLPDLEPLRQEYTAQIETVAKAIPTIPAQKDYAPDIAATKEELLDEIAKLREELRNVRTTSGVAVSNLRIQQAFKYILKTEAPVGDIDGVNTTYTVTQPIFAVLAFSLNGETIAQLPNYTIAGKTITFATALPAAYSGKDFECKYI